MKSCSLTAPCTFIGRASNGESGFTGRDTACVVSAESRTRSVALVAGPASSVVVAGLSVDALCAAAVDDGGLLGSRSNFTELLPGGRVRGSSPATTSTSRGGRTARLVITGAILVSAAGPDRA